MRAALPPSAAALGLGAILLAFCSLAGSRGERILARVNGEPITAEEFLGEVASIHERAGESDRPSGQPDLRGVLDRLVTVRLVVQEARRIGLAELPEFRREMDSFRLETLERLLLERQVRRIERPSPASIERRRRRIVGQAKISAIALREEPAARKAIERLRRGEPFEAVASELLSAGEASRWGTERVAKLFELPESVAEAIAALEPGQTSEPIPFEGGFLLVHLLELDAPEDPSARRQAESESLAAERLEAVGRYTAGLEHRYAKIDEKLLEELDFDRAESSLDAYEKDDRVLVEIEGGEPIRVGDLARALKRRFFHGAAQAARQKRLNRAKQSALHDLIVRRTTVLEALRLGLDRSEAFRAALLEHERAVLFGLFVEKVIGPEARLDEGKVRRFYEEHRADYATPERVRLEALAFRGREDAVRALEKLRQGADFEWTRQNAPGTASQPAEELRPEFGGALVALAALEEGVRSCLIGAQPGELRLCSEPEGPHFVVRVREVVPGSVPPFEEIREAVARRAEGERRKELLEEWARRLRAASKVVLYATPEVLRAVVDSRWGATP